MATKSSFSVNVVGRLWSGGRSAYSYQSPVALGDTDYHQVKSLAGDFSEVEDFEIVSHSTRIIPLHDGVRTIIDRRVVKQWASPEAESFYEDSQLF